MVSPVPRIDLVIPSRAQPRQREFLEAALASVRAQTVAGQVEVRCIVGVDQGQPLPHGLAGSLGLTVAESGGRTQAEALNAALAQVGNPDFVALLEDDDQWMPRYLEMALQAVAGFDFVSSTQAEVNDAGQLLRVNDFPTPSGWFMPAATLRRVGGFDPTYRWHLDNDWLGRLSATGARRLHLVESTAPIVAELARPVRPWLGRVLDQSRGTCRLGRHPWPEPLVRRLVHAGSGLSRIAADPVLRAASEAEQHRLIARHGHLPW